MIWDCCIFFNELELLEIRLHTLDPVVDRFVIIESYETHSGKPKPLYFDENKERFQAFQHKIEHVVLSEFGYDTPTGREHTQRDYILEVLSEASPTDLIHIADIDEIPNPNKMDQEGIFVQKMYYNYLNLLAPYPWRCSYTRQLQNFNQSPSYYRDQLHAGLYENVNLPFIEDGGWHFTSLGGVERIKAKLDAFLHQEYNNEEVYNGLEDALKNHTDIFGRGESYQRVPIDSSYPFYIVNNQEKFANLIAP